MPVAPDPGIPSVTGLFWVAFRLERIAMEFDDIYDDIKDIVFLGRYLAAPFKVIRDAFFAASSKCYEADITVRKVKGWVDALAAGYKFREILEWVSIQFRYIREDPVRWVKDKIREIGGEIGFFIDNPVLWVQFKIRGIVYWFGTFLENPVSFILSKIQAHTYWFRAFLENPIGYAVSWVTNGLSFIRELRDDATGTVIRWIRNRYYLFEDLIRDPIGFIRNRLHSLWYELWSLQSYPLNWLYGKLQQLFGWSSFDMGDLPLWILRHALARIGGYRAYIEYSLREAIVTVTLWFV